MIAYDGATRMPWRVYAAPRSVAAQWIIEKQYIVPCSWLIMVHLVSQGQFGEREYEQLIIPNESIDAFVIRTS